jgi:hypothetical protein
MDSVQRGIVIHDNLVHVARRRITGPYASCGAGRIIQLVQGKGDHTDPNACPNCFGAVGESEPR